MSQSPCPMLLLVQADIDGELDAGRAADLIIHRADCPDCQAAHAEIMMLRERLRAPERREKAPESLRRFLAQQSASVTPLPGPAPPPPRWRSPIALAAGMALAAGLALMAYHPAAPDPLGLVIDAHLRSLQAGHLEDVVSTDRHTVKPWFEGKLDFAPPVKDLAAENFPLIGGRLDVMEGRPVAALVYRGGTHPINLLVWPAKQADDSEPRDESRRGFTMLHWRQNGMELWAVSDIEKAKLEDFVRLWRSAP